MISSTLYSYSLSYYFFLFYSHQFLPFHSRRDVDFELFLFAAFQQFTLLFVFLSYYFLSYPTTLLFSPPPTIFFPSLPKWTFSSLLTSTIITCTFSSLLTSTIIFLLFLPPLHLFTVLFSSLTFFILLSLFFSFLYSSSSLTIIFFILLHLFPL
ncbi:unnamed protein product [Acanthosepion pharaonis]|uniref:Uncharacterized protein n=1 Tax=Acanthosepion pharaonis TaxID=158019 RepID=A0A812CCR4_ACAPH|nr:unnamed protein product [Sepia pharaonis]